MKLILCKGLPASGKSTWSKKFIMDNNNVVRVNRDEIREMLGLSHEHWSKEYENKVVVKGEKSFVRGALSLGMDCIIDDTNLNPSVQNMWMKIGEEFEAEVEIKEFNISPEECIKRDILRDRTVGEEVIMKMYNAYVVGDNTNSNSDNNSTSISQEE